MAQYKVGYFVGSLSSTSINRMLAKALVRLAPAELVLGEIPIRDLPLGAAEPARRAVLLQFAADEQRRGLHPLQAGAHQR